ncbi:MAG: hypothetical protein MZV65_42600 [Chromatiales bacterium]|nr:hypothetical protein [Chromatiales bacterium]
MFIQSLRARDEQRADARLREGPEGQCAADVRQLLALIGRLRQCLPTLSAQALSQPLMMRVSPACTAPSMLFNPSLRGTRTMTPSQIRDAVRTLQTQGRSLREISRALKLSRNTVRRILRAAVPAAQEAAHYGLTLTYLQSAFERAQGNVVRVQQLLAAEYDLEISYSTLTRWVREAGLRAPPARAGEYAFGPGEEMQHDTSPHRVRIGREDRDRPVCRSRAGLLAPPVRPVLPALQPLRGQAVPARGRTLHGRGLSGVHHRQHQRDARRRCRRERPHRSRDGRASPARWASNSALTGSAIRIARDASRRNFFFVETNFLPGRSFTDFDDLNAPGARLVPGGGQRQRPSARWACRPRPPT